MHVMDLVKHVQSCNLDHGSTEQKYEVVFYLTFFGQYIIPTLPFVLSDSFDDFIIIDQCGPTFDW